MGEEGSSQNLPQAARTQLARKAVLSRDSSELQGLHTNRACHRPDVVAPEYRARAECKWVDRKLAGSYHLGLVDLSDKD